MTEEFFLFIDTETTGFHKGGDLIQQGQARVCQLAMLLTDASGKSLHEFSSLIKPDNWTIGKGAQEAHGFTDHDCERFGISGKGATVLYQRIASISTLIIAHNIGFDRKLMEIEEAYTGLPPLTRPWYCTQDASTPIVNLPPTEKMVAAGRNHAKTCGLEEALEFFCGRTLGETAHNAMYDVQACRDIFFAIRKRNEVAA